MNVHFTSSKLCIKHWMSPFPPLSPLFNLFLVQLRPKGGASCHRVQPSRFWLSWLVAGAEPSGTSHDTHHPGFAMYLVNIFQKQDRVNMKRLGDTVLGLLLAQVCCELALPHRESEGTQLLFVEGGGELTSPADFLSLSFMGWRHGIYGVIIMVLSGFCREPVILTCDCFFLLIRCEMGWMWGRSPPALESPGGSWSSTLR